MDDQEIGSLVEAVHWTYFNAIRVLAVDAGFCYDVRHDDLVLNERVANPAIVNSVPWHRGLQGRGLACPLCS